MRKGEIMPVDVQTIKTLDFFKDLTYSELNEFANFLKPMTVKEGDVIIRRGTRAMTFFVILSGAFEISFEKDRSITLDKKGKIMGWSTIVAPYSYTATVTALTDADLLYISGRDFFLMMQTNNALGDKIMRKVNKIATERRVFFSGSE